MSLIVKLIYFNKVWIINRVNVLPEIDDVVDGVEDWVVDGVGLSEAPFRIPLTHGNI